MKSFILTNIVMIYKGTIYQKVTSAISLSIVPAFIIGLFENVTEWYIDNHIFIMLSFLILAIDHILGSWAHWTIKRDFKFSKNIVGLMTKCIIISLGYTTLSVIAYTMRDIDFLRTYFVSIIQLITVLYPGSSALSNMSLITKGRFPPTGLLEKIKNFNQNLNPEEFKGKNKNDEEA